MVLGMLFLIPLAIVIRNRVEDARSGGVVEPGAPIPASIIEVLRSSGKYVPIFMEPVVLFTSLMGVVLWAVFVWQGHGFGKRDYHWSLPVNRPAHDLWRVAAGATWLIAALLVLLAIGGGFTLLEGIPLFPEGSWPFWLSFIAVPVLVYLAVSIPAVATRYPGVWIYAGIAVVFGLMVIQSSDISPTLSQVLAFFLTGTAPRSDSIALIPTLSHGYGSGFAAWVQAFAEAHEGPTRVPIEGRYSLILRHSGLLLRGWHSTWLLSLALWMAIIFAALYLAARRKA